MRISNGPDMGHHVLLNIYDSSVALLSDLAKFETFANSLLPGCNAQILKTSSHQFDGGFTLLYLLTTSHFSIHTWPEHCCASIDIFTCGPVETDKIVEGIVSYFGTTRLSLQDVLR